MRRLNKKTNKSAQVPKERIVEDGIGSNYHTLDNMPITFFHDDRVDVEMYPTAWGKYGVEITCPELKYDTGFRTFSNEEQATLWARNQYTDIVSKLNARAEIVENVIKRLLENSSRDQEIS